MAGPFLAVLVAAALALWTFFRASLEKSCWPSGAVPMSILAQALELRNDIPHHATKRKNFLKLLYGATQINFVIPPTAPLGVQPVVVTVGGIPSPAETITVGQ